MAKCTGVRCPMQYGYKVEECNQTDCPYRTEPITNADRILAMNDEELAEHIAGIIDDANSGSIIYSNRKEEWLEWLKQPAEVD